jgi:hypothetical protein
MISAPPTAADRRAWLALLEREPAQGVGAERMARLDAMGLLEAGPAFVPSRRARRLWGLLLLLAAGAVGCGGAPFVLAAEQAPLDAEGGAALDPPDAPLDAAPLLPDAASGDARSLGEVLVDAGAGEAGDADAGGEASDASDANASEASAEGAASGPLCCAGAFESSCSAAAWVCFAAGSICSEDCAPTADGGQTCATHCTGAPASCASAGACTLGLSCILTDPRGQTLPGAVAPCP